MTTPAPLIDRDQFLSHLAAEVCKVHQHCLRELHIEVVAGGCVLIGRTVSFYGKQVAFHEVSRRLQMKVIANRIEVQEE